MESHVIPVLSKNDLLHEKYRVLLFIKQGANAQTYRVKSNDGQVSFLKLFNVSQTQPAAFDDEGNLLEVEILKNAQHPNVVAYRDSGEIIVGQQKYLYLVLNFIAGETLAERALRERISTAYDVRQFALGILAGLRHLHQQPSCIVHNEITPQNIMLDLSSGTPLPIIIDFGHARSFYQSSKSYSRRGLNPYYLAPECFSGIFSPQSDLFAVGALMYQLLFGIPPWFKDVPPYRLEREKIEDIIAAERLRPLVYPSMEGKVIGLNDALLQVVIKALQTDTELRFKSAEEFMDALNSSAVISAAPLSSALMQGYGPTNTAAKRTEKPTGGGFDAVAGMQPLKDMLKTEVIDALLDPKRYAEYGITIPNGMLLYGPPGCGKTFFAKKFAEEVGYTLIEVKPSDVASIYVHGTQEKIAKVFDEAKQKAPTILFIDELDALVPNREGDINHSYASEVNEFLSQMTNCSEHGVFIVAATNRPEKIDTAILRSGRLDKKVYLPPPDFEVRKAMFELYLKNRPVEFGMDYSRLADLTDDMVSSDIELIVNDTARSALKAQSRISMQLLEQTIRDFRPSVSAFELRKYEAIREKMEGAGDTNTSSGRRQIGFNKS